MTSPTPLLNFLNSFIRLMGAINDDLSIDEIQRLQKKTNKAADVLEIYLGDQLPTEGMLPDQRKAHEIAIEGAEHLMAVTKVIGQEAANSVSLHEGFRGEVAAMVAKHSSLSWVSYALRVFEEQCHD